MLAVGVLSIVMLVLGTLSTAIAGFPFADASASQQITEETPFGREPVQATADQFGTMYEAIIGELMTHMDDLENPDYARAEARRVEITAYASVLAGQFDDLSERLQAKGDEITAAPATPTSLAATGADGMVSLDWDDAVSDISIYNVYRASTAGGPYGLVAGTTISRFIDSGLMNSTTYYYVVTAAGPFGNESDHSNEAAATPLP